MDIKVDILELRQKVESHATAINQLEQQFGKMSATFNQSQLGTLLSSTILNSNNDSN